MTVPSSDARFTALFDRYYPLLRSYCLRRLSVEDANDALADIFMVAWRRLDAVPDGDAARPWLYGVAGNVVANQLRSGRRRSRLRARLTVAALHENAPPADVVVLRRSEDGALLAALERLKPGEREVLRLKVWEGLTHAEIGTVLGISPHAVDMRASRATRKLGRLLENPRSPISSPRPIEEGGES